MKIEILGTGCPKCQALKKNVEQAVKELSIQADIRHVKDMDKIVKYQVMITPGLVIDGQLKSSGKVADVNEIKDFLK